MAKTEKDISKVCEYSPRPKIRMTRKRLLADQLILFDTANPPDGLKLGQVLPEAVSNFLNENLRMPVSRRKRRAGEKSGM